jgi:two-component system OmpR family response regulator
MKNTNEIKIFLVGDDAVFFNLLETEFLQHTNFVVETFVTGELCVEKLLYDPHVVILDYQLADNRNQMNGIETLDKIKAFNPDIPVVMLSSQDKVDVAINCMYHEAFDYVMKSETTFMRLQKIISNILHYKEIEKELSWYM